MQINMVYIQNRKGEPIMPTNRHGKVRRMLKAGMAEVTLTSPFTIRLKYDTTCHIQTVNLGVDAGVAHIGLSATTKGKELYAAEVSSRTDIVKLLAEKRDLRHDRRVRKLRHRKERWSNRKKPQGWLPPSIDNCIKNHLCMIDLVHKILPISTLTIEVAQFNVQLLEDPFIEGLDFQKGDKFGFWNAREYVLFRDNHTCQHCFGKSGDKILNVHHIESRRTGGNTPNNLITLCESCHKQHHLGEISLKINRGQNFCHAGVMGSMRWKLYNLAKDIYPKVGLTHGFTTKFYRIRNGLPKSHIVDARCISGNPSATALSEYFFFKQVRRHNRKIHKTKTLRGGVKKLNQAPYLVKGFRLFDKVLYEGTKCFVFGRRSRGYFDLRTLDGTRIHPCAKYDKLKLLSRPKGFLIETRKVAE